MYLLTQAFPQTPNQLGGRGPALRVAVLVLFVYKYLKQPLYNLVLLLAQLMFVNK